MKIYECFFYFLVFSLRAHCSVLVEASTSFSPIQNILFYFYFCCEGPVDMNDELRKIRREQWLNSKQASEKDRERNQNDGAAIAKPILHRMQEKLERPLKKLKPVIDLISSDDEDVRQPTRVSKSSRVLDKDAIIKMVSYNVWFGPPYPEVRMQAIISELVSKGIPLLVGFQEVTHELSSTLFPLLRSLGYEVQSQNLSNQNYGCAIAMLTKRESSVNSKSSNCRIIGSGFFPYQNTIMSRGLLWVHARLDLFDTDLVFCTTHLESYIPNYPTFGINYTGAKERKSQIIEATQFCEKYIEKNEKVTAAFITGDLNWDDERKRSKGIDSVLLNVIKGEHWKDAWIEARKLKKINKGERIEGYTYDSTLNPMLKGNLRRRFDRCIYFTKQRMNNEETVRVDSISLIGKDIIEGFRYEKKSLKWGGRGESTVTQLPLMPSDHFGLESTFAFKNNLTNQKPLTSMEGL